jgi:hypothetical protein
MPLAMPARRKAPTFDDGDFVRHIGVHRIMRDRVNPRLRHDLTRLYSCATGVLKWNRCCSRNIMTASCVPWQREAEAPNCTQSLHGFG